MAGPEGFDASLIETEALLKKMKPRPANLSAARIVYEAGRAVGKEEAQALLASGGLVLASPSVAATWKKWILPSWAAGSTVLCLLLWFQFGGRAPKATEPQDYVRYPQPTYHSPQMTSPYPSSGYGQGSENRTVESRAVENQIVERNASTPERAEIDGLVTPVAGAKGVNTQANAESQNQSGVPRDVYDRSPAKPREKNLAEYLRDQFPSLEPRRRIDPLEIRDNVPQPSGSGMALTALGFIKTP